MPAIRKPRSRRRATRLAPELGRRHRPREEREIHRRQVRQLAHIPAGPVALNAPDITTTERLRDSIIAPCCFVVRYAGLRWRHSPTGAVRADSRRRRRATHCARMRVSRRCGVPDEPTCHEMRVGRPVDVDFPGLMPERRARHTQSPSARPSTNRLGLWFPCPSFAAPQTPGPSRSSNLMLRVSRMKSRANIADCSVDCVNSG